MIGRGLSQGAAPWRALACGVVATAAWAVVASGQPVPAASPAPAQAAPRGYLGPAAWPDSAALLPPPPAAGSAALARDEALEQAARALRGTARWHQAKRDSDLFSPLATGAFSCAAGRVISPEATPATDRLLRRALIDFAGSTNAAKVRYGRARPFVANKLPICTPDAAAALRANGSYPSGHAAIGAGWGLILGALIPAHKAALLARGQAFGDSRRVCNVHWASDIAAGGKVAQATYAALSLDPDFVADREAARAEIARLPPLKPDCTAEHAALKR